MTQAKKTPQVEALPGMTPLGIKPTSSRSERLEQLIASTEHELEYVNKQIVQSADYLIRQLQQAVKSVETGMRVNECGVLQGNGTDFDKLIAKRQLIADKLKELKWVHTVQA